jgi:hypothetical protein
VVDQLGTALARIVAGHHDGRVALADVAIRDLGRYRLPVPEPQLGWERPGRLDQALENSSHLPG